MTGRAVTLALAATLAAASVTLLVARNTAMWPFGNEKRALVDVLGAASDAWVRDATITAWTPDLNAKPKSYFLVRQASEDQFRSWASAAGLSVTATPSIPSGVLMLPPSVSVSGWLDPENKRAALLDAQGSTASASLWARWQDGTAYTVVHPTY